MTMPDIRHERRVWDRRDRSNNVVERFDVIETWARMPGVGVWVLIASAPYSEVQ